MSQIQSTLRRTLTNITVYSLSVLPIISTHTANAAEFCMDMTVLTSQARTNFLQQANDVTSLISPKPLPDAEKCAMTRSLSGSNAYHCAWKFSYRDTAANDTFDVFNQMMRDCFSDSTEVIKDQGVNHPDSYHQRQHIVDEVAVAISIKDKSVLQETYVFVNVQGETPN